MIVRRRKVGFIARGLTPGGVERFIKEVASRLDQKDAEQFDIMILIDKPLNFSNKNVFFIQTPDMPRLIWDWIYLPIMALKFKFDLVVYTKNVIPWTHLLFKWKKVVIIYDLGFLYPKLDAYRTLDTLYQKLLLPFTLRIADKIIVISSFVKDEVIKFYPNVSKDKLAILHLGVSDIFFKKDNRRISNRLKQKLRLNQPFVFYAGSISPRKQIVSAVKAFLKSPLSKTHYFYIFSGKGWKNDDFYRFMSTTKQSKVRLKSFISDSDLSEVYTLSSALFYPSIYEGFGLPLLEAAANKRPLIIHKTLLTKSILSELKIITKPAFGEYLTCTITDSVERFTWSKTKKQLIRILIST